MFRLSAAVIALALSCGSASSEQAAAPPATKQQPSIEAKARAAIAAKMRDPESTRIRSSRRKGDILCGTYNAKNAMGGYGDHEMFVYVISTNTIMLLDAQNPRFREALALWEQNGCVYPR